MFLVFLAAILLSLFIEFPFINLEKEFLFPSKPRPNKKKSNPEAARRVYGAGGLGAGSIANLSDHMSVESSGSGNEMLVNGDRERQSIVLQDLSRPES